MTDNKDLLFLTQLLNKRNGPVFNVNEILMPLSVLLIFGYLLFQKQPPAHFYPQPWHGRSLSDLPQQRHFQPREAFEPQIEYWNPETYF